MAITVRCSCGKKSLVGDKLAGGTIRCTACGNEVAVGAPSAPSPAAAKAKAQAAGSGLSINPTIMIVGIVGILGLVTGLILYFGPWRISTQWAAMKPRANTEVTDVVDFSIRAYESEHGMYDAGTSHLAPRADGDAKFIDPVMSFSMPRKMTFVGKTNEGSYIGTWDTTTGEVVADIETGGYSVGGMVDVSKATGKFHVTGREKDGTVTAEVDGEPLHIAVRNPLPR